MQKQTLHWFVSWHIHMSIGKILTCGLGSMTVLIFISLTALSSGTTAHKAMGQNSETVITDRWTVITDRWSAFCVFGRGLGGRALGGRALYDPVEGPLIQGRPLAPPLIALLLDIAPVQMCYKQELIFFFFNSSAYFRSASRNRSWRSHTCFTVHQLAG